MREKNYIEQATNLERTTENYVPRKLYDELLNEYEKEQTDWMLASHDGEELEKCLKEVGDVMLDHSKKASEAELSLYVTDINQAKAMKTFKRPINVCPYCGKTMFLSWADDAYTYNSYRSLYRQIKRPADNVCFTCPVCGASSPCVRLTTSMLNEDEVGKRIGRHIEDSIAEMEELKGAVENDDE